MKLIHFILFLMLVNTFPEGLGQAREWMNYTVTNHPYSTLAVSNSDIWTCTDGGIVRIDKDTEEIINYNHAYSFLRFNPTRGFVDSDEYIWFYDIKNIGFYKNDLWEPLKATDCLGDHEYISKVIVSETNKVYLATYYNNAVYQIIDDTLLRIYTSETPFPENQITDIEITADDELWIAEIGAVRCLNGIDTLVFNSENSALPNEFITNIFIDKDDNLWVIPEGAGDVSILKFDGTEWTSWGKSVFANFDITWNAMDEDENGTVFLSSFNGIFKFEYGSWGKMDSLISNYLAIGPENNLWCLSGDQIRLKTSNGWKSYALRINELDDQVNYCLSNDLNVIYIAGESRIASFDGLTWDKYTGLKEVRLMAVSGQGTTMAFIDGEMKISSDMVAWQNLYHNHFPTNKKDYFKIYAVSGHEFLIGTNNGLFLFQNKEISQALDIRINDIGQDDHGNFWLATDQGLIQYNEGILEIFNTENSSLESNYISHVCIGTNDDIWLAVQKIIENYPYYYIESYLTNFENGVFENLDTLCCGDMNAIFYNSGFPIEKIVAGMDNDLWINYKFLGIMNYKNEVFSLYNFENSGLADNNINDLYIDSASNVFILHDKALSVYNRHGINFGLHDGSVENQLLVYPNPSNGIFHFVFDKMITGSICINIFDITGKLVKSDVWNAEPHTIRVDINYLKPGLYIYRMKGKDRTYSGKLILGK